MSQHPSARLTPMGHRTLCKRVEAGEPVSAAARQMGVSSVFCQLDVSRMVINF